MLNHRIYIKMLQYYDIRGIAIGDITCPKTTVEAIEKVVFIVNFELVNVCCVLKDAGLFTTKWDNSCYGCATIVLLQNETNFTTMWGK